MPNQPNASATFPGENGKIAFTSDGSSNPGISVMNAEWSNGQIDKSRESGRGPYNCSNTRAR